MTTSTPLVMALEFGRGTTCLLVDGRFFSLDELKKRGLVSFMDGVILEQLRAKLLVLTDKLGQAGELA